MGFMDELRKLTQPYEEEDDFYEGANPAAGVRRPSGRKRKRKTLLLRHRRAGRESSPGSAERSPHDPESLPGSGQWSSAGPSSR